MHAYKYQLPGHRTRIIYNKKYVHKLIKFEEQWSITSGICSHFQVSLYGHCPDRCGRMRYRRSRESDIQGRYKQETPEKKCPFNHVIFLRDNVAPKSINFTSEM
jgi:hypothetical protein